VLVAVACLLALGTAAFWPAGRWVTPRRPALEAPIVFDELENFRNPSADSGTTTQAP
jgi:hypothetical protein